MYYIYVLISNADNQFYVGFTNDLKTRLDSHAKGNVESTRNRRPLRLVYYEGCLNRDDALKRERYLKTTWGKRYIRTRIRNYMGLK
jgi:putative endonuclease